MTTETCVLLPEIRENQLVIPETIDGLKLSDFMPVLRKYEEINKTLVFEYRDDKGNKAARSHVAKLRKIKTPIATIHKELKAEYKAITDQMDKDKREAIAIVENMIEHHDRELKIVAEEEAAEQRRLMIEREIADCWDMAHEMNDMHTQQRELAKQAEEQAMIAAEQAEIQRQLQIEKDKKEAAERAAEEARLAEKARAAQAIREAELRAQREKEESEARERKAKEDADRAIKEAEEKAAREKAAYEAKVEQEKAAEAARIERDRQREEEARANLENINRVHAAIIEAMNNVGITDEQANAVINLIRDGEFPALSIDYQWEDVGFPL